MTMKHFKLILLLIVIIFITLGCKNKEDLYSKQVDIFIGTANDQGQLDPSATVPYGMIKVCPDCILPSHVGYDFEQTQITGFSINRISGIGCRGVGGNITLKPSYKEDTLRIIKDTEIGSCGYYAAELSNQVSVEFTATQNVAVEKYNFKNSILKKIAIDISTSFSEIIDYKYDIISSKNISGRICAKNACDNGLYTLHFYMDFDKNFSIEKKDSANILLSFTENIIEVRIGISPISTEVAQKEIKEIKTCSFDDIRQKASELWEEKLAKIQVSGNDSANTMFYTMLYRCFQSPVNVTSKDSLFLNSKGKLERTKNFTYYSSWSTWDTYRTKFPLLTLVDPKAMANFTQSMIQLYKTGKNSWATQHESCPTVRTEHMSIILLDAYNKGIPNIKFEEIYDSLINEMQQLPLVSPDNYLEAAYDYWALSQISHIIGNKHNEMIFNQESQKIWKYIWNKKFKNIHNELFDIMHGEGLYEGTLWQYRWAIPYDIKGLAKEAGGKERLCKELEYFFKNGLYNHGNQPDLHAAYIFNRLNRPDLTQYWTHQIMNHPLPHWYGTHKKRNKPYFDLAYKPIPRAFIPEMDDDDGTMAAWYICSAIGLYPLIPGIPEYEITTPLFPNIKIKLENNKSFYIKCKNFNKENIYIKKIFLNGKEIHRHHIKHKEILEGGTLELILSKNN